MKLREEQHKELSVIRKYCTHLPRASLLTDEKLLEVVERALEESRGTNQFWAIFERHIHS